MSRNVNRNIERKKEKKPEQKIQIYPTKNAKLVLIGNVNFVQLNLCWSKWRRWDFLTNNWNTYIKLSAVCLNFFKKTTYVFACFSTSLKHMKTNCLKIQFSVVIPVHKNSLVTKLTINTKKTNTTNWIIPTIAGNEWNFFFVKLT